MHLMWYNAAMDDAILTVTFFLTESGREWLKELIGKTANTGYRLATGPEAKEFVGKRGEKK